MKSSQNVNNKRGYLWIYKENEKNNTEQRQLNRENMSYRLCAYKEILLKILYYRNQVR